jgi:hypothetical protein
VKKAMKKQAFVNTSKNLKAVAIEGRLPILRRIKECCDQ